MTQPGPTWRKSTRSDGSGACVEVASTGGGMAVRDSKNPDSPILILDRGGFRSLLSRAKTGTFDR